MNVDITLRVVTGREDVDVPGCFSAAPDAADMVEDDRRAFRAQVVEQQVGRLGGIGQQVASGVLLPLGARPENELFLLRSKPLSVRTRPSPHAASSSSMVLMPSSVYNRATVFGPTP